MIVLENVAKRYGRLTVLKGISMQINPGEFVCITGASGAGKSTLTHILSSAETYSSGSVKIDGIELSDVPAPVLQLYRQRIGIVFQDYKLLPTRTVAENIAFPLEVTGVPRPKIEKRVKELLKEMELTKHKDALPHHLSGGEKARVAIARAIAHKPTILLADEPTGNLDPDHSFEILDLFKAIHKKGTTVILATHDKDLVDALKTRVIRLEDGEIARDSAGTYKKGSKKKLAEEHHGKHKIFAETEVADVKETGTKSSKHKIKIIPVQSRNGDE